MTKIEALELELNARKMVEGAELDWWDVIKLSNRVCEDPPHFTLGKGDYELALGIVEGKPVWVNIELFSKLNGRTYNITVMPIDPQNWSWNPPDWSWNSPAPKTSSIRDRLSANANDFDTIVSELLAENDALHKALEEVK